jgi:uncharacterized protein (DUF2345 family)
MPEPQNIRSEFTRRSDNTARPAEPGIYIGRVIGHLDQTFMGGLNVSLLRANANGSDWDEIGQSLQCQYASPFAGQTPLHQAGSDNTFASSQQSYGFWAVPPDIGTKVIVLVVEGRKDFGFWMACVPDAFTNFTVPDGRTSTYLNDLGQKLPVGEYNKAITSPDGETQPTKYIKPVNTDFVEGLNRAGLITDDVRGLTTSGARRELPSTVFGMNTPGPFDKRPNAPLYQHGENETEFYKARLGGSSIVMDDGDDKFLRKGHPESTPFEYADIEKTTDTGDVTRPANELFRIRTRTGHQILLHNTEDLIYISNSKGTSWIEMSSNGKIDVYAQDSVSVHSENDINFTADRDINLTAMENMNISAGKDIAIDAGASYGVSAQNEISLNAGANVSLTGQDGIALYGNTKVSITSKGTLDVLGQQHLSIGSSESIGIEACSFVKVSTDGDYHMKALGNSYNQVDGQAHFNSALQTYITSANTLELYSTGATKLYSQALMSLQADGANIQTTASEIHLNSDSYPADTAIESRTATLPPAPNPFIPIPPVRANLAARIPEHEPWPQHENINPAAYTQDKTRAGQQQVNSFLQNVLPDTYAAVGTGSQTPAVSSSAEVDTNASVASDPAAFPNASSGQYAIIQVGVGDIGDVEKAKQNLREGYASLSTAGYRVVVIAPNINPAFGHPLENDLRILGNAINATATELGAIVENPKYTQEDPLIIDPDAAQEIADKYRSTAVYYGDTVAQTVAGLSGATVKSASSTQAIAEQSAEVSNAVLQQDYPAAGTEGGSYGCAGPSDGPLSAPPAGTINGFSAAETVAYLNALGFRESGLKYNCTNSIGFAGKYQFGGYALKEGGYIKMTTRGGGTRLRLDPNNWTGKNGVNNVDDWLANKGDCQEDAMILYTNANLRYCKNNGAIKENDPVSLVAGILMGAHLKGPNDAKKWRRKEAVGTDGYGTKIDEYIALGRATVPNTGRFIG